MLRSRKNKFNPLLGQFLMIHGSFITFFPLHFPPCLALIDTVLNLVRVPGPHVLLQSFMLQDPHSQSIATAKKLSKIMSKNHLGYDFLYIISNKQSTNVQLKKHLRLQQDFLQCILTTWDLHHGLIWLRHPLDIAWLYRLLHLFVFLSFVQENWFLHPCLSSFGYLSTVAQPIKNNYLHYCT